MTQSDNIRRRRDGSIDTAHYIGEGRAARSRAARSLGDRSQRPTHRTAPGLLVVLGLFLMALPFLPGLG